MKKPDTVDPQRYRDAMAHFGGAVQIVTTQGPAGLRGSTVIAACSVSDNPATVLVCLNKSSAGNDLFIQNGVFALNVCSRHHKPLAEAFAGRAGIDPENRFTLAEWTELETGAPVLSDSLASFDCRLIEHKEFSTHRVLFGRVTGVRIGGNVDPLMYFDRDYHVL